jgi:hypothetical protein
VRATRTERARRAIRVERCFSVLVVLLVEDSRGKTAERGEDWYMGKSRGEDFVDDMEVVVMGKESECGGEGEDVIKRT